MKYATLTLILLVLALPAAAQEPALPIPWANKFFTGPNTAPPPVILKDFGTLPKGTVKTYRFKMTNIYAVPMQVDEPHPNCGCVSVIEYTGQMGPMETGHIDVQLDTSRYDGAREVEVPVTFRGQDPKTKQPFFSTAKLYIKTVIRSDISFSPGEFAFGTVPQGKDASLTVNVVYSGPQPDWKITEIAANKDLFDIKADPVRVARGRAYQVTLTLKKGAPAGNVNEAVELKTNEPGNKAVLALNVTGFVQAPLAVLGPSQVRFNNGVEVGKREERNVPIQAMVPFKITEVEGQGDGVTVAVLPVQANKAQVVTVVFAPEKPGPVKKTLTVKTNIGKSVTIEVEGTGKEPQ
jgi:hypothetical protein